MDIQKELNDKYRTQVSIPKIRRCLKYELHYSYKRWAPRPVDLNMQNQAYSKAYSSAKISKNIDCFDVLINIDETTLNKATKENYSWTQIGIPTPIWNITFKNSVSIIAAITTEGLSFWWLRAGSTDSSVFVDYLTDLVAYLKGHSKFKLKRMWLILDNAKYHTSSKTLKFLNSLDAKTYFLPAYSPEL